jgi:3-hydroxyisobutyrate dehydrogenase-like beta-hydroxyacid dehydrogenase
MALNMARAGHDLVLWNRSPRNLAGFDSAKPTMAGTPIEAVTGAEITVTMLGDDQAVHDVVLRAGVLDAMAPEAVHLSMSSISVRCVTHLAEMHAAKNQGFVSAPVFGRPDVAAAGKLWVVAGGQRFTIERVRPLLDAVSRGVTLAGEQPWQANLVKLGNNVMLASMLEAFGEAYALIRKAGIAPELLLEVVNALFQSPVYANYGELAAKRRHQPALFKAKLGLKDLRLAREAAQDLSVPLPLVELAFETLSSAIEHGGSELDWSVLATEAQRRAGLT